MLDVQFSNTEYNVDGFRNFMQSMYNHTAFGLGQSFLVAFAVYAMGLTSFFMSGLMLWITMLAPLGMILYYSFRGQDWDLPTLTGFYYTFVTVMGVSLSTIFVRFTATSIVEALLVSALTFGCAALYGQVTKRDLSGMGNILMFGLVGIIIAAIVNLFLQSSGFSFIISCVGVVLFLGLTAYDTNVAKQIYAETEDPRYGIKFALALYLNFINLFQMILSLTGMREE